MGALMKPPSEGLRAHVRPPKFCLMNNRPLAHDKPGPRATIGTGDAAVAQTGRNHVGQPRLLDRLRHEVRLRHYALRTEQAYVDWVRRYVLFHGKRHPSEMGGPEVAAFLTHLAVERHVAPATQAQAKSALLFLYRVVLNTALPWVNEVVSPHIPQRLPVVLTPGEVRRLLAEMSGTAGLLAGVLYGTGMRLMEGLRRSVAA